jgi:hypothetical protein
VADAEAEIGQWSGPSHVSRLEPNRLTAGSGGEPHAVAEQDRGEVDDDLVEQPALEALLGEI